MEEGIQLLLMDSLPDVSGQPMGRDRYGPREFHHTLLPDGPHFFGHQRTLGYGWGLDRPWGHDPVIGGVVVAVPLHSDVW